MLEISHEKREDIYCPKCGKAIYFDMFCDSCGWGAESKWTELKDMLNHEDYESAQKLIDSGYLLRKDGKVLADEKEQQAIAKERNSKIRLIGILLASSVLTFLLPMKLYPSNIKTILEYLFTLVGCFFIFSIALAAGEIILDRFNAYSLSTIKSLSTKACAVILIAFCVLSAYKLQETKRIAAMTEDEREQYIDSSEDDIDPRDDDFRLFK